ncbi:hypothetical protein O181_002061, partial [Austropuccinia psidii MF-1]|nr:hypothetical protein [Austropuccinia psidii MF-1]
MEGSSKTLHSFLVDSLSHWQDEQVKKDLSTKILESLAHFNPLISSHQQSITLDLLLIFSTLFKSCLPRITHSDPKIKLPIIKSSDLIEFLSQSIYPQLNQEIHNKTSEMMVDTIWSIENELEAQKSSIEDQIKSIQSQINSTHQVNNLNDDSSSTNQSTPQSILIRQNALQTLSQARQALIQLSTLMLKSNQNGTILINPAHCKLSWEYGLLYETGLIPFTADLITKQATRLNTGLHYKQQRFNLLREESEGYSHLTTELISAMGPGQMAQLISSQSNTGNQTSYPHLRSIIQSSESLQLCNLRIDKVINNIKALIGYFDLDPNRTLDIILDVFSYNILTHHSFFCSLLKKSHWMKSVQDLPVTEIQINHPNGTLPSQSGSKLIASLLGFKFNHYQQIEGNDSTPEELYFTTAILIWHQIIKLSDILPHLSPDLQTIKQYESDWRQEISNKASSAGPRNALSMAGALDNSGPPSSFSKPINPTLNKSLDSLSKSSSNKPKNLPNQKIGLLSALLSIGALHEAIYILSLPSHQFLAHQDSNISALVLRLIDVIINPAYQLALNPSKSQSINTLTQPKKRYLGGSSGIHQLVEPEIPKATLSLKLGPRSVSLSTSNVKFEPVFFWSAWKERLIQVKSNEEFLNHVWPLLRFVGPFGHLHMSVFQKVAELTAIALQSQSTDPALPPDPRWSYLLRWFLLPGLSMMQGCVAASNVVWKVLRTFPYEQRYMIYGEWKERIYVRIPELKVERAKADAETKRILKTMTLDNLKEKSRALAKLACSNPCIVFNAALNQVQTYDSLIPCVIECLRYLNLFALDVLTYSVVEFLSNPDKDRSKSDGTNIAGWLQNLAKFVGNVFKRNLSLDPTIVLQYIANQLANGNAKDLIILRDMISKMAGVEVLQDLSASQVVALGGSRTLRSEAISPTTLTGKKISFSKSSNRLMRALSDSGLTVPLLILIALQRQNAVLLSDENAHLKYLGVLADSCQQVLFQYIDFLRGQLACRDISDYEKALPTIDEMWGKYHIDPSIIFQVWRPVLSAAVRPALKIGSDGEVSVEDNDKMEISPPSLSTQLTAQASPQPPTQTLTQSDDPNALELNGQLSNDQIYYPTNLMPAVLLAEKMLPEQTRKLVGPHFFVTFWQLELYDIRMPDERYISETSRLNTMLSDLDREYAIPMVSSMKELNRAHRSKILEIRSTLTKEMKIHIKHYELTRARLAAEKAYWFPLSARSPFRAQLLEHIIQHCFNPRAKLSPVDAAYTAQFIKTVHSLGSTSFMTLKLFDRIFSSDVGPTIFPCSEFEASNYGRFLRDLLLLVKSWYDSESIFKKTGLGKDKKGNYLPGLRMKWGKGENAGDGIAESDMLSYDNLQKVVKKWTSIMSTICKEALQSGEYMHIRNSIAVLKELDGLVPLFEDQANNLEIAVTELLKYDKREDVKVLAYGYQSMLKRAAKNVIKTTKVPIVSATRKPNHPTTNNPSVPNPMVDKVENKLIGNETPTMATPSLPLKNPKSSPKLSNSAGGSSTMPKPSNSSSSVVESRSVLPPISSTTNRPPGLPERPAGPSSRLPPSISRHENDRKLLPVPNRSLNGNLSHRNGSELEHASFPPSDPSRSQLLAPPTIPSAEAAEREALARAAVQRSRKFPPNPAALPPSQSESSSLHHPSQQKDDLPRYSSSSHPMHFPDRPYLSSHHNHSNDPQSRTPNMGPFNSKATRPPINALTSEGSNHGDELMRPPALPSAPRSDHIRRDMSSFYPSSIMHQPLPNHPSPHFGSNSNTTSPRTRDDLSKRGPDELFPNRHRDERDLYERREEREHRRVRDEAPRTRPPSVESIRSIKSGRDKDKRGERNERNEKRKRSRSPSERHRDRDRDRDRDREREKEKEKDRERERDRKDREKDRELRHREKEKELGREERDKDRDRDRDRRSHRRDRDRGDERRHDKEREKDRERELKSTSEAVTDDGGIKRRKVLPSGPSISTEGLTATSSSSDLRSKRGGDSPHQNDERDLGKDISNSKGNLKTNHSQ